MRPAEAACLALLSLLAVATAAVGAEAADPGASKSAGSTADSALRLLPTSSELFTPVESETALSLTARQGERWKAALEEALRLAGIPHTVLWRELLPELEEEDETAPESSTGPRKELIDCLNEPGVWGSYLSWQDAMWDKSLGNFKAAAAWSHSDQPQQPGLPPLTVTTTASLSRLPQLYAQCLSWQGPLSAVVYQPLLQERSNNKRLTSQNRAVLRGAVQKVSQFMADMKTVPEACKPEVVLVYEVFAEDLSRRLLYPFNTLRNLARLQARTPLIAMIDVDLLISRSLFQRVSEPAKLQEMMKAAQKDKKVFIIPALDVHGQHEKAAWAQALVTADKELLVAAMRKNIAFQFASEKYPPGHNLTNFAKWMVTSQDYDVQFESLCEPWIIGDRMALPWADSRYRGYGFDKVQLIADVAASGFGFRVLHDSFIIHRAHQQNEARARFLKFKKPEQGEPTLFTHNMGLWENQTKLHEEKKPFKPVLHPATQNCKASLTWWGQGTAASKGPAQQPPQQSQSQQQQQPPKSRKRLDEEEMRRLLR